jgi:dTDP-4-dehydrorhamnose reductase
MILILGASGMLGHKLAEELADLGAVALSRLDYEAFDSLEPFNLTQNDWVINCIGSIPQRNDDAETFIRLNALFPKFLAETKASVIQIATDCVFDGAKGSYTESDPKTAKDIYGLTKYLGEVSRDRFLNLRASIIGPELSSKKSLFEWVRTQPEGASIYGFANHYWNGVTTQAFAKVVKGLIKTNIKLGATFHLVPADRVSKYQLVKMIAAVTERTDLNIEPRIVDPIDRTLQTDFPNLNSMFWRVAGYESAPTIQEMIFENETVN